MTVPIFERLLNIPTSYRLWRFPRRQPLLERIPVAQGSFTHSRHVAELAYVAAKTVGANPLLAQWERCSRYRQKRPPNTTSRIKAKKTSMTTSSPASPSRSSKVCKTRVEKGRKRAPQEVLNIITSITAMTSFGFLLRSDQRAQAHSGR